MRRLALIAASAAVLSVAATSNAAIYITEWQYNGSEFFELTNVGGPAVDFTGWSYSDSARAPGAISLSAFGTVTAGQSVILSEAAEADFRSLWSLSPSVKVIGGNTANLGRSDEINIYDASSNLIDRLTYDDQVIGGVRTNGVSGHIALENLGLNKANLAIAAVAGDAYGSYASSAAQLGSPGVYPVPEPAAFGLLAPATLLLARRRR